MTTFHLFPQLPPELRRNIWRICLPHRTLELDVPTGLILFDLDSGDQSPCDLYKTTYENLLPPIISRVCRESREVAFATGHVTVFEEGKPENTGWISSTTIDGCAPSWEDPIRDSIHLNWTDVYRADYGGYGHPLGCLAWNASRMRGGGSMMFSFLQYKNYDYESGSYKPASEMIERLRFLPSWRVVVRVVVVHADFKTAVATGLFGLLGEELVQLVDVSDEARINAFLDLDTQEACNIVHMSEERLVEKQSGTGPFTRTIKVRGKYSTDRRDVLESPVEAVNQRLKDLIVQKFGVENKVPPMHPVIMFRLCKHMCKVEVLPPPPRRGFHNQRGRGRGRGRGGNGPA